MLGGSDVEGTHLKKESVFVDRASSEGVELDFKAFLKTAVRAVVVAQELIKVDHLCVVSGEHWHSRDLAGTLS